MSTPHAPGCHDPDRWKYTHEPCPCGATWAWDGHFPGCATSGCTLTDCASARLQVAMIKEMAARRGSSGF